MPRKLQTYRQRWRRIFARLWRADAAPRVQLRRRLFVFFALMFVVGALGIWRLYFLQVMHGERFRAMAQGQYISRNVNFFDRGRIYFQRKDGTLFSAATIQSGYTLAINPSRITDPAAVYERLALLLPELDRTRFLAQAQKKNDPYEEVAFRIDRETGRKIAALRLPGVMLVPQRWRMYPGGSLAAQVIGFLAYGPDGSYAGRYGLEKYYNDFLSRNAETLRMNFFAAIFTQMRGLFEAEHGTRHGNLITTIEPTVQATLADILSQVRHEQRAQFAAGVVMDPNTGAIRALAVVPEFDLNAFRHVSPERFNNLVVQDVYEMGSIIKPLTVAAGIDAGAVRPESTYHDEGVVVVDGHRIYNYDKKGRGPGTTLTEVLAHSLNTGVVYVMRRLGKDRFRAYFEKFGLFEETGIDLPYEAVNLVENLESPRTIEYATASFGQGIALTPISTIRALGALATGQLVQPHVVAAVETLAGIRYEKSYGDQKKQVLKPQTVEAVTRMLVSAVDHTLGGGKYRLPHHRIAAKTGTAQVPDPNGGYKEGQVLHTFMGYFPAYDPQFVVLLMLMDPQEDPYASQTLSKPFFDFARFLINYYDIPPDR